MSGAGPVVERPTYRSVGQGEAGGPGCHIVRPEGVIGVWRMPYAGLRQPGSIPGPIARGEVRSAAAGEAQRNHRPAKDRGVLGNQRDQRMVSASTPTPTSSGRVDR